MLYCAEIKKFSHLFKVIQDAEETSAETRSGIAWDHWCWADCAVELGGPIPLRDVRGEPLLTEWVAARLNFHGTAFPIAPSEWQALLTLAPPSDRLALRRVGD